MALGSIECLRHFLQHDVLEKMNVSPERALMRAALFTIFKSSLTNISSSLLLLLHFTSVEIHAGYKVVTVFTVMYKLTMLLIIFMSFGLEWTSKHWALNNLENKYTLINFGQPSFTKHCTQPQTYCIQSADGQWLRLLLCLKVDDGDGIGRIHSESFTSSYV